MKEVRKFGKAIWDITGKGVNVDMVFEHPGEATFPVSVFVVKRGGMVVICAGTTGFNLTIDARYLWMHQKRVQGSHFANLKQASAANQLMLERRLDPCMSEVFPWAEIPAAHMKMLRNEHKPGNMAVLVAGAEPGLRTFEDALEASRPDLLRNCHEPPRLSVDRRFPADLRSGDGLVCGLHRMLLPAGSSVRVNSPPFKASCPGAFDRVAMTGLSTC